MRLRTLVFFAVVGVLLTSCSAEDQGLPQLQETVPVEVPKAADTLPASSEIGKEPFHGPKPDTKDGTVQEEGHEPGVDVEDKYESPPEDSGFNGPPLPGGENEPCPDSPFFSVSPVDFSKIDHVVPLGNLNPPGHTFPTDHMYISLTRQPGANRPDIATLYSPGNLVITSVSASQHVNAGFTDFDISLQPCDRVRIVLGHVSSLAPELFGETDLEDGWTLVNEYTTGDETYRRWSKEYHIEVQAGEVIGTTGGNNDQWCLDIGVYDQRITTSQAANPERWRRHGDYLFAACFLDYYGEGEVLESLISLVSRDPVDGEGLPCGSVIQDISGTAQGAWFLEGAPEYAQEDANLALVYSNFHPNQPVISTGTSIPGLVSGVYAFPPEDSGVLNRRFSDVVSGDDIFGYTFPEFPGTVIVFMPDPDTLWVEALPGGGTDPVSWKFSDDKTVFVR